jgi:malonate-semialdehyde dehydrogenase (acetylating)/methylmalonate-semialdehyde dehydrogenase
MGPVVTGCQGAHRRLHRLRASTRGPRWCSTVAGSSRGRAARQAYFLGATLFDNVTPDMKIYREEIFGPVLCVVRVDTFAEAVELINSHMLRQRRRLLHP